METISSRLASAAARLGPALAAAAVASVAFTGGAPAAGSSPSILAPADVIVGEADGHVDLKVTLSAPSSSPIAVNYTTADSSATAGAACDSDYVAEAGTLNFAAFQTSQTVQVAIRDCPNVEGLEAFRLKLGSPVNGVIARPAAQVAIVDNDNVVASPAIVAGNATIDEKDGLVLVPVLLGGTGGQASAGTVTVDYATADGSASAGSDYTSKTGTLTFTPGQTAKTVAVPIADDAGREPPESFTLTLSNAAGATIARADGTITIGASDGTAVSQPRISAPFDLAVGESDGFADLVVSLSAPGKSAVSVAYSTQAVTATAGTACPNADFVPTSSTLTFLPGEMTKVVRVDILDCPAVEPAETFDFQLSSPTNAVLDDPGTAVTIADNDGPTVRLSSIAVTPANPAVAAGADRQFAATGTFSDGHTDDLTATVTWASSSASVATVSAAGLAHGMSGGSSTLSATQDGLTGSTNLAVGGLIQQTITFAPLPGKVYGDPAFAVSASASSGFDVSFAASGACVVNTATVSLTGAGSCTITASQPGDGAYGPAAPVARTFAIAKALQAIVFAALPGKLVGDADFQISATASSGLAVDFAAAEMCTVTPSLPATVHLLGVGECTITASQAGNANFEAAAPVAHTFPIAPLPICKVPRVVGRTLAKARALIVLRHCRVGKVARAYSRVRRAGLVIAQGRRAGQVVTQGTRVALTVSRGPRRR